MGTRGGGLNRFDPKSEKFENFQDYGFASNIIYHIIPENESKLWISTNAGISEFNIETNKIRNHGFSEGVLGTQFVTGSGFKDKNGVIYLGSTEGLNFFNPSDIFTNNQGSKLNFTDFKIFNKNISYLNNKAIDKHISLAKEIKLDHKQSVFTIYFSYLNFIHPDKTQYGVSINWF